MAAQLRKCCSSPQLERLVKEPASASGSSGLLAEAPGTDVWVALRGFKEFGGPLLASVKPFCEDAGVSSARQLAVPFAC